mmetsp:Transcript_11051/g.16103  ORF Transcript_11051/g.16103 Transcript_11051/m.16103 type:complete len:287 (+) Transcript_11051:88-948(+)
MFNLSLPSVASKQIKPCMNYIHRNSSKYYKLHKNTRWRWMSSSSASQQRTKIHIIGGEKFDDVKQIRLVQLPTIEKPDPVTIASICVKRNIIFGARQHVKSTSKEEGKNDKGLVKTCLPLLKRGLELAGSEGNQPQGLATLNGLSAYCRRALNNPETSEAMVELMDLAQNKGDESSAIILEAVQAVATQVPRKGHIIVGDGTYQDARPGWTKLAEEYATLRGPGNEKDKTIDDGISNGVDDFNLVEGEPQLFQKMGATLVNIEYIGDENPRYWIQSGGAMARFFFF